MNSMQETLRVSNYSSLFLKIWTKVLGKKISVEEQLLAGQFQGKSKLPRYITEVKNWGINNAKWKACKQFCDDRNWKFQILTEREINGYNY